MAMELSYFRIMDPRNSALSIVRILRFLDATSSSFSELIAAVYTTRSKEGSMLAEDCPIEILAPIFSSFSVI